MIIDFRCKPPILEAMQVHVNPPEHIAGYGGAYTKGQFHGTVDDFVMGPEKFLAKLDAAGVDRVVFCAGDRETTVGRVLRNDTLVEFARFDPDRFICFAGADPHKGMSAVRELERAVRDLGMRGLFLSPWEHMLPPNHAKFYPLYAKCCELDVPIILHCSINFSYTIPMEYGNPQYLDQVACDFPELKIIASHGGWPWVPQMCAVAWKHPKIFIEISGVSPKYIGMPNSGWEVLLQFGNSVLQDRILYGSDWPLLELDRTVTEVRDLPLKEEVKAKWLGLNAARLLDLH